MPVSPDSPSPSPAAHSGESSKASLVGVPLTVVFAEGEQIEKVRKAGKGSLKLEPPYHLSDGDAYLVLPDDIGMEIVDIMQDHDLDLLHEAMRDGLLVDGVVDESSRESSQDDAESASSEEAEKSDEESDGRSLRVRRSWTPRKVLKQGEPVYGAQIMVGNGNDPLDEINELDHLKITVVSRLFDDEGLDRSLRKKESVGISWRSSGMDALSPDGVDPTYAWTKRIAQGRVGVEFALFCEYEELVALIRPLELRFRV